MKGGLNLLERNAALHLSPVFPLLAKRAGRHGGGGEKALRVFYQLVETHRTALGMAHATFELKLPLFEHVYALGLVLSSCRHQLQSPGDYQGAILEVGCHAVEKLRAKLTTSQSSIDLTDFFRGQVDCHLLEICCQILHEGGGKTGEMPASEVNLRNVFQKTTQAIFLWLVSDDAVTVVGLDVQRETCRLNEFKESFNLDLYHRVASRSAYGVQEFRTVAKNAQELLVISPHLVSGYCIVSLLRPLWEHFCLANRRSSGLDEVLIKKLSSSNIMLQIELLRQALVHGTDTISHRLVANENHLSPFSIELQQHAKLLHFMWRPMCSNAISTIGK